MTEPTDAELISLLGDRQFTTIGAVREALRRWGTPPAVAGEPVAWRYRPSAVWDDYVLTDDPGKAARARGNGLHVEALCLTTPQPTQAQAGAVPLTCEWTHNDDDGFWETACGKAWRFDDGGPKENNMNFCHCCGKTLRIKGKEAGNAE